MYSALEREKSSLFQDYLYPVWKREENCKYCTFTCLVKTVRIKSIEKPYKSIEMKTGRGMKAWTI